MKKTTGKKSVRPTKKRSSTQTTRRRKSTSASTVTVRKSKPAISTVASKGKPVAKKLVSKTSRALAVRPSASDKATQVGRAVGTMLGKAIGNVERAVSRVTKNSKSAIKKITG